MKLAAHILLVTAITDAERESKEETAAMNTVKASQHMVEGRQLHMGRGKEQQAAEAFIKAAAHLCVAADKLIHGRV